MFIYTLPAGKDYKHVHLAGVYIGTQTYEERTNNWSTLLTNLKSWTHAAEEENLKAVEAWLRSEEGIKWLYIRRLQLLNAIPFVADKDTMRVKADALHIVIQELEHGPLSR